MGGKISYEQRKVQQSYYGYICPITTAEGEVGRYMSPTLYNTFTNASEIAPYVEFIKNIKEIHSNYEDI